MSKTKPRWSLKMLARWLAVLPGAAVASFIFVVVFDLLSPILVMLWGLELPNKSSTIFDATVDVEWGTTVVRLLKSACQALVFVAAGSHIAPAKRGPTAIALGMVFCIPVLGFGGIAMVEAWGTGPFMLLLELVGLLAAFVVLVLEPPRVVPPGVHARAGRGILVMSPWCAARA